MEFDFTGVNESGFVLVKPGRYEVEVDQWYKRRKEETGNDVFDVDVKFTDGPYQGQTVRYFTGVTEKSIGFVLAMFSALGLVSDKDRVLGADGQPGPLKAKAVYGEKDSYGRQEVTAIEVNGENRPVKGRKAIAVITNEPNASGEMTTRVQRLEKPKQSAQQCPF